MTDVIDIIETLSDERKAIIYSIVLDMASAQEADSDSYSPEDVKAIQDARERVLNGDCVSFSSVEEMTAYYS